MALYRYLLIVFLTAVTAKIFAQAKQDSITIAVGPEYDEANKVHRFFFGESYRKLWSAPVKMRVFHLSKEKGGLKITEKGGGMQTKSLRLEDPTGQEWVIRTIQKYPERVLPPTLRKTIAESIIKDQIADEHPFSAVVIPPLAEALSVPHANPEIVYVADDPAFGQYRKDFINQVFLFEEREPLDARKTDNTDKASEKLREDNDNSVDQITVLRARLLDMLVGDWDRHGDQWRWEKKKTDKGNVYEPIPRDRDQVFYSSSGVIPWLVSRYLLMSKFQSYQDHIRAINRWNLNARNFDRYFLNELNEKDWEEQIAFVQSKLTDDVLTAAVKRMPDTIYKLCGPDIVSKLIHRKNILKEQGMKYYRFLSSQVDVLGTDKHENFDITNEPDGSVKLIVNKINKEGEKEQVIYNRTFDPKITKEVRLYGFAEKDVFAMHGREHSPITVRMIGGDDNDTFAVDGDITAKGNRYVYDRSDQPNKLPAKNQVHLLTAADTIVNQYKKKDFEYDFFQPLFLVSYNKDYGVQLIGKFTYQKQGFRKEPYAFRQSMTINYGLGVSSLMINYGGEFKDAIGKNDLVLSVLDKGPNYTSNFFGIGNNSDFINSGAKKIRYYRNVYNYINADIRLRHTYNNWTVSAGVAAQYYNGDEDSNSGRLLNDYDALHPEQNVFGQQTLVGLVSDITLDTRDKGLVPHKGILWKTSLTGMKELNPNAHSYGQIVSEFSFLLNPDNESKLVFADRIGGGTTIGNAAYYQQLKLGGSSNLRGFYTWRFTGKSMAYNNFEVRVKLSDFASYLLPGTLGMIGFDDVGRVWTPGELSSTWHNGFGGGFYFEPGQLLLVQGVVGFSKEGAYPYVSAGFRF
ncbi:MAG: BamA/TamA family outer membrane protein [Bacteroidota bacterium]